MLAAFVQTIFLLCFENYVALYPGFSSHVFCTKIPEHILLTSSIIKKKKKTLPNPYEIPASLCF